jgi:pimeloyl-ACP methyl ester carboxylesterase
MTKNHFSGIDIFQCHEQGENMIKTPATLLFGFFLFLYASLSSAELVKLTNASGKVIAADYLQGTNNAPPVLLLHGFLQTKEFSTVSRLVNVLQDLGYSVLNPTLSLGISDRKQSLSCEAIHTHSLDSDADEIKQWIAWLHEKTGKPVTLIGHSAGGPVMLKYMEDSNAKYINHTILISLPYYSAGSMSRENSELVEKALKAVSSGSNPLATYALSYCDTYPSYASDFLSYYTWDRDKISSVVDKFNERITIILGSGDKRMDEAWQQQLQTRHNNVIIIEGANHFFDQAHEFDLADAIEDILAENLNR